MFEISFENYENNFNDDEADDIREQTLPNINAGDVLKVSALNLTKGQTKLPAPFNEGTLLSAMEKCIE